MRVAEAADRAGSLPADLAACPDCVALHSDLVAIAAALPDAAIPARPRDYRLGPADAARLRRTGWRRWLAAVGTSRDTVTRPLAIGLTTLGLARPLAIGLTTLGLAGLLLTALPSLPFAGTASAPARDPAGGGEMVVQGAAATSKAPAPDMSFPGDAGLAPAAGGDVRSDGSIGEAAAGPAITSSAGVNQGLVDDDVLVASEDTVTPLVLVSGLFLLLGVGLFGLRVASGRRLIR